MTALSVTNHVLLMTNIPADQPLGGGWETVGRCVNRALHDLEPERSRRLDGLVNIGIDETSYKKDDPELAIVKAAKVKADEIKSSAYALGKAPEHLTEKQQLRVSLISSQNPRLYRAYLLKEQLR